MGVDEGLQQRAREIRGPLLELNQAQVQGDDWIPASSPPRGLEDSFGLREIMGSIGEDSVEQQHPMVGREATATLRHVITSQVQSIGRHESGPQLVEGVSRAVATFVVQAQVLDGLLFSGVGVAT